VFDPLDEALAVAMRGYWTSFATSGAPVAPSSIVWPVSTLSVSLLVSSRLDTLQAAGDDNGSPRILLHPGNITVEDVSDSLSQRCEFWHDLASELFT
jgi:hypothetical protein